MELLAALEGNFIPFAAGLAGLGGAIGVGLAGAKGAEAVGRNPGAFGKVFTTTLIAMAPVSYTHLTLPTICSV